MMGLTNFIVYIDKKRRIIMEKNKVLEKLDEYYKKIGEIVNFLPKGSWEQIVVRICKDKRHNSFGIYIQKDGVFKLASEYIEIGKIDRCKFNDILSQLDDIADEIQEELCKYNQEVWKSLVFTLWDDGKYIVECSYDELDDDFRECAVWRYKKLGMIPDEQTMKYIQNMEYQHL